MKRIICFFKGHKRGKTKVTEHSGIFCWGINCKRCGYKVNYWSPRARLVGTELELGFDGN